MHTAYYESSEHWEQDVIRLSASAGMADALAVDFWPHNMDTGLQKFEWLSVAESMIEAAIRNDIAEALRRAPAVEAIYMQRHRYDIRVSVLLNTPVYDDSVIDKLLDIEYPLHLNDYGDFLLDFRHFPDIDDVRNSAIPPDAIPVFER